MEAEEHFYSDDPAVGPADVRTTLKDVNYFFIGNGHISAAVQFSPHGEGTSLGLIIMHPEVFGPKRNTLTFDVKTGLAQTGLTAIFQESKLTSDSGNLDVWWENEDSVPVIHASWGNEQVTINERFYCPNLADPLLIRDISIKNHSNIPTFFNLQTGVRTQVIETPLALSPGGEEVRSLGYKLIGQYPEFSVEFSWVNRPKFSHDLRKYWSKINSCQFDSQILNHMFNASRNQIFANIASSGKLDASIWQYNLEWVRDQAMTVFGLVVSGHFERAKKMLDRLLTQFVTHKGDTLDSSQERPTAEVELDQNGELLFVLQIYVDWTGDISIIEKHWDKVCAVADFPLQAAFKHPETALLHNQREYWERHELHGIEDGMELTYQLFVSIGLMSAAHIAELLGYKSEKKKWRLAAEEIKNSLLFDPRYALVDDGHFIKRRHVDGEIQREVCVKNNTSLPKEIPILERGSHYLNPDSSSALPIAFGFVDPSSELAKKTMVQIEQLWNQRWHGGGYSRYNVTSEPDSPGPWPFASLFIAKAYLEMEDHEKVWRILEWLSSVSGSKSGAWFEFYGPRPIPPYPQIGIIPWIWAEHLIFFVHHLLGIRPSRNKLLLRPRLLSNIENGDVSIRVRDVRLNIHLQKVRNNAKAGLKINGTFYPYDKGGILIDMPESDLDIEVMFP